MGKQFTVRKVLQILKEEGFIKSPTHKSAGRHQRYIHKDDPTRFADISSHGGGLVIPKGTLSSIEKTSKVKF